MVEIDEAANRGIKLGPVAILSTSTTFDWTQIPKCLFWAYTKAFMIILLVLGSAFNLKCVDWKTLGLVTLHCKYEGNEPNKQ